MDDMFKYLVSHLGSEEIYSGCYLNVIQFERTSFFKNLKKDFYAVNQFVTEVFSLLKLLISSGELLKSFVLWVKCLYICSNSTHSASRKNSKWVFFFLGQSLTHNTLPLLLCKVHLGGLFFFSKPYSLIPNTVN